MMEQKKLTKLMAWIILPMVTLGGMLITFGAFLDTKIPIGQFYSNVPSLVGFGLFGLGVVVFMVFNATHGRNGKVQD